jgi:hypothetical protein
LQRCFNCAKQRSVDIGLRLLGPANAQFTQQGGKLVGTGATGAYGAYGGLALQGFAVALSADGNTAIVGGFNDDYTSGAGGLGAAWMYTRSGGVWTQQGSKLVGTGAVGNADEAQSVALSGDGNTAIVGGTNDNNGAGAAWVFTRSGGVWTQQGSKLVGTGAAGAANQGSSVALSADGNTAIVGGANDNGGKGAVWVFTRSGGVWTQQGSKLVGTGAVGNANQGQSVALSGDGNTAIAGGYNDNGGGGAAWVYTQSGGVWTQQGSKLVGTGAIGNADQGFKVALSSDGSAAIVGGPTDSGAAGAAWVYTQSGGVWTQQGSKLVGAGAAGAANQGDSVALSADGNTALVGGPCDNGSNCPPPGYGVPAYPSAVGAAWVYTRSGGAWTQLGSKLVGTGAIGNANQGDSAALSGDGNTAIVGGPLDNYGCCNASVGAAWVFVAPVTRTPLQFYPLPPCRIADTRTSQPFTGAFGPPSLAAYTDRTFPILYSVCSIPPTAQAYSLNFTVVPDGPLGFLSAWPAGQSYPGVSTLNSTDGSVIANAAIVPAGTSGGITVVAGDPTDLVIDINGYFAPASGSSLEFFPLTPCRIADTRTTQPFTGAFGPPSLSGYVTRDFPIATSPCLTGSEQAYSLNMTVVPPAPMGFLSVWPVGQSYPGVSTLNSPDGTVIANAAIVPAGTNGDIDVVVGNPTDLIIDINGKFAVPEAGGLQFYAVTPCRVADTRASQPFTGAFGPPSLAAYTGRNFPIQSSPCGISATAQAYALNMTVVPQGPLGFLSAWPAGQPYPTVSTLNSPDGDVIANAAIVPAGTDGEITVVTGNPTDLIIDIVGYFAP